MGEGVFVFVGLSGIVIPIGGGNYPSKKDNYQPQYSLPHDCNFSIHPNPDSVKCLIIEAGITSVTQLCPRTNPACPSAESLLLPVSLSAMVSRSFRRDKMVR